MPPLSLPVFGRNKACTDCPLHEGCRTVCIPSRPFSTQPGRILKGRALFIVGEAPGANEDEDGHCWVGAAGQLLKRLYVDEVFQFQDRADVYLGNTVRCRPPKNATPSKSQVKKCLPYLWADLNEVCDKYKEVWVLCCGATAIAPFGFKSLRDALSHQGDWKELPETGLTPPPQVRIFSTYHPAYLLRNPSASAVVETHLRMMQRAMDGVGTLDFQPSNLNIEVNPEPPDYPISRLSLDIETYGAVDNCPDQTQFHPRKSLEYDRCGPANLIQSVGIAWRDPRDETQHTAIFTATLGFGRLWDWLRKLRRDDGTLLGQNLQFDLSYLRFGYPQARELLDIPLRLEDLSVTNYLHSEVRPERSLKNLAPLFGVTKYERSAGGQFRKFQDCNDEGLWRYNCQDALATLLTQERLEEAIEGYYGAQSEKLGPFCKQWYSDLLWLVLWMGEQGIAMDVPKLWHLLTRYNRRLDRLTNYAQVRWEMPLRGKGSAKAKTEAILAAADEAPDHVRSGLKLTDKTEQISFKDENRNALLDVLDRRTEVAKKLRVIGRYASTAKLIDSYLTPLLAGRGKDNHDVSPKVLRGLVFPRWYPVPLQFDDGGGGGTIQARVVCKAPAVQTFPKPIKKCITTRFESGCTLWFDYCLTGDTEIYTVEGFRRIDDVVLNGTEGVLSCSSSGELSFQKPTKTVQIENAELVRIDLVHGEYVECTPDHKWMLWDGSFKEARHLKPGDRLTHVSHKAKYCSRSCYGQGKNNHQVAGITPAGTGTVYCLRVPPHATFVLRNGLVSSNSQIELRTAALLSNDPVMMEEYLGKPDLHTKTARLIFGDAFIDEYIANRGLDAFKESQYRQAGKTLNFLVLYRGGAFKFRETLMRDVGLEYPMEKCQAAIDAFWRRHKGLISWQDELIATATKTGRVVLPLIGQSRLFLGGKAGVAGSVNEVVNLPVQATAANIMLSAHFSLAKIFKTQNLRAVVPLNIYDAAAIDLPASELSAVQRIVAEVLPNPPYYEALCSRLGRRLKLAYDCHTITKPMRAAT